MSELALITLLCGAGTFLLRVLPIWQTRRKPHLKVASGPIQAFLQGIGPAAITALLVVSLWPMAADAPRQALHSLAILAALGTIWAIKRVLGGIAGPTLAGALIYGIGMHLLMS